MALHSPRRGASKIITARKRVAMWHETLQQHGTTTTRERAALASRWALPVPGRKWHIAPCHISSRYTQNWHDHAHRNPPSNGVNCKFICSLCRLPTWGCCRKKHWNFTRAWTWMLPNKIQALTDKYIHPSIKIYQLQPTSLTPITWCLETRV